MQIIILIAIFLGIVLFNAIVPTLVEMFCSQPWSKLNREDTTKVTVNKFNIDYSDKYKWWEKFPVSRLVVNFLWFVIFLVFVLSYGTRSNDGITIELASKMFIIFLMGWPLTLRATNQINYAGFATKTASVPQLEQPGNISSAVTNVFKRKGKDQPKYDYYLIGQVISDVGKRVLFRGLGVTIVALVLILLIL